MKIVVKTPELRFKIRLYLPLSLSAFVLKKVGRATTKKYADIDFSMMAKSLHILKKYKGLKLVEVRSKDGTEINIVV